MRNIGIVIFVLFLFVVLLMAFTSFQVRETECVLVTTFGKPTRQITEPGWNFKWPPPIQSVYKFDSRMRVFEIEQGETTTKGAAPIIVKIYVVWRIDKPLEFYNAHGQGSIKEAERTLRNQIEDTKNRVIGRHAFGEFVNSDPDKVKFGEIEEEMLKDLQNAIADAEYGITVETLGIKQLKISQDMTEKVFERMRTARNLKTEITKSEGMAQAVKITSDANAKKLKLMAAATARATAIRGQGDAQAAQYYKLLDEDPEFAIFLRKTEALKEILKENTTLMIPADSEPFDLLKEVPKLDPNQPK